MNIQEAELLVENELSKVKEQHNQIDCIILREDTIEKTWGWVFFYQSKDYVESGDFRHMLSGNAPIIVNRKTGELLHTGTAREVDHYIDKYETSLEPDT